MRKRGEDTSSLFLLTLDKNDVLTFTSLSVSNY